MNGVAFQPAQAAQATCARSWTESEMAIEQALRTMKIDLRAAELLLKALGDHPSPEEALAAFTMPTLVVCGSEDDDNGSARELAAALPNARYEEIPGTHMSSVTKPELGESVVPSWSLGPSGVVFAAACL